jgi:hypothetical protein
MRSQLLIYKEGNVNIARTPMRRNGDNIILASPIEIGTQFQFSFSNTANLSNGIKKNRI